MSLTFLRRKSLGAGSCKGMVAFIDNHEPERVSALAHKGDSVNVIRKDKIETPNGKDILNNTDWLVRWGCTSPAGFKNSNTINISSAIKQVAHKSGFRKLIANSNEAYLAPKTIFSLGEAENVDFPLVLRPEAHSQGRNLWLVNSYQELVDRVQSEPCLRKGNWYASEYINKVAEYRIYVVSGRVVTVANKTPDDPNAVAWNVAQGGRFDVVRFGDWYLNALDVAVRSFNYTGLDFGGVDIMVDDKGRAYLIEVNSAPSLPVMVEGQHSYRQQCMAKALMYISERGKERMEVGEGNWKQYIHPSISDKAMLDWIELV